MRVFRPTYRDRKGRKKTVSRWWFELRDHNQIIRRFPGYSGKAHAKRLTESLGNQIEKLVGYKAAGEPPDPKLSLWLDGVNGKLRDRLVKFGLIDRGRVERQKPLDDYLPEFGETVYQSSEGTRRKKERTGNTQARLRVGRVRQIVEGCNFDVWADVDPDKINAYIRQRREKGISDQTARFYAQAWRSFARWMVDAKGCEKKPDIARIEAPHNYGRAFELDEFRGLLDAARYGAPMFGLTGYERYLVYRLAVETGLRRGELRSLTVASFDFKNNCVFLRAEDTKNGDEAAQFITDETSVLLKEHVKGKMPNVRLFNLHDKTSKMIQADCESAGIELENGRGKLTFHSLRHTCGTYLAAQGAHPKEIQEIMRHRDINLTMSRYTHLLSGRKRAAVNRMPKFSQPEVKDKTA